jgi:hypothetical protein
MTIVEGANIGVGLVLEALGLRRQHHLAVYLHEIHGVLRLVLAVGAAPQEELSGLAVAIDQRRQRQVAPQCSATLRRRRARSPAVCWLVVGLDRGALARERQLLLLRAPIAACTLVNLHPERMYLAAATRAQRFTAS